MTTTNDVHSKTFESKMDSFFTTAYQLDKWSRYARMDKDTARSALATTRPLKTHEPENPVPEREQ